MSRVTFNCLLLMPLPIIGPDSMDELEKILSDQSEDGYSLITTFESAITRKDGYGNPYQAPYLFGIFKKD